MDANIWSQRPCPVPGAGAAVLGVWEPATPAEVTSARRQLSAVLHDGGRPAAGVEGAVERLLLCQEELASNALRHGRPPVRVEVVAGEGWWLLDVSDADPATAPAPAVGRDPARGGLGLHLVARIAGAHGWTADGHRKHVWALVHQVPSEAADPAPTSVPGGSAAPGSGTGAR